jgi:hypothetical protein
MLKPSRWYARAALMGGALSVAQGLLILSNPGYYDYASFRDRLLLAVEGAALLATLVGLVGLHVRQAGDYGRPGVAGFVAGRCRYRHGRGRTPPRGAFFDFVNVGGITYVLFSLKEGFFSLGGMVYVLGVVGMSVGYPLLGVATTRAGTLPVWSGLALIAGMIGLWAGNALGWVVFGLAWVAVGISLWLDPGARSGPSKTSGESRGSRRRPTLANPREALRWPNTARRHRPSDGITPPQASRSPIAKPCRRPLRGYVPNDRLWKAPADACGRSRTRTRDFAGRGR